MQNFYERILFHLTHRQIIVLATIISRIGSAPRTSGARMIILPDGQIEGTIGGGSLEGRCIQAAMEIHQDQTSRVMDFHLTGRDAASSEMICGGTQSVLLEWLNPADKGIMDLFTAASESLRSREPAWWVSQLPMPGRSTAVYKAIVGENGAITSTAMSEEFDVQWTADGPQVFIAGKQIALRSIRQAARISGKDNEYVLMPLEQYGTVYIFGAGHVSQQLAKLTSMVGFHTVVIDDRSEFASVDRFPSADEVIVMENYAGIYDQLIINTDAYGVIITRGHLHDLSVLEQSLQQNYAYLGMIGSKRKVETIYKELERRGYSKTALDRVHAPIGVSIGAESPEEIAVSITAELIQHRATITNRA